jgi:hypothetical protein
LWQLKVSTIGVIEAMQKAGKRLSVTFTWDDPKIYRKPQTYEYIYYKDPPSTYAFEEWCDSSDPLQRQSIVPPPQK